MSFYNYKEVRKLLNKNRSLRELRRFVGQDENAKAAFQETVTMILGLNSQVKQLKADAKRDSKIHADEIDTLTNDFKDIEEGYEDDLRELRNYIEENGL